MTKFKAAVWTTIFVAFLTGITLALLALGKNTMQHALQPSTSYEETIPVWFPKGATVYTEMYSKELNEKVKATRNIIIPVNEDDPSARRAEQLDIIQKLADGWDVCVLVPEGGNTIYYNAFKDGFRMSGQMTFDQRPDTGDLIPKMSLTNTHLAGVEYIQMPAIHINWTAANGWWIRPSRIIGSIILFILGGFVICALTIVFYVLLLHDWKPWDHQWPRKWQLRTPKPA